MRKIRYAPLKSAKSKSGGARICYVYFEEYAIVLLILAYPKKEKGDLSHAEKRAIKKLITEDRGGVRQRLPEIKRCGLLELQEAIAVKPSISRKRPVGSRVIERLEGFKTALKRDQKITERFTCRKVMLDLEPTLYGPEQVKQTRHLLNASQALFAKFLGVSVSTVRAWEHGTSTPSAMACRFMEEIRCDPEHWIERLKSTIVYK